MSKDEHPKGWVDKNPKPKIPKITEKDEQACQLKAVLVLAQANGKREFREKIPYGSWIKLKAHEIIDMADQEKSEKIERAYRQGWDQAKEGF